MSQRPFALGRSRPAVDSSKEQSNFELPAHHLVTHGVVVGMTGSGKTGLCMGIIEEALRSRIPILMVDIKGDLANLALAFDDLDPQHFAPWVDADSARRDGKTVDEVATSIASRWREGLAQWGLGPNDVRALRENTRLRIITPGTTAGEPLHVLSPLETQSKLWDLDEEAARESVSAAISLLLRMVEREADPTRGREHVLLSHLAERRLRAGQAAGLEELLADLREPPIERVGALSVDEFLPPKERAELSKDLNALVASPTFATWRQGAPLDVGAWMSFQDDGRVPATIISVSHLEDDERMLVLGMILEQALAWVRGLSGTTDLRAIILFDEVFGYLPPHPSNPPTKKPLLSLLKQARAFGVGCILATQNPIDLDYKALSNAGVWFVGRLQTDADRERVVEGLVGSDTAAKGVASDQLDSEGLASLIKSLPPRTFFVRDVHLAGQSQLLETRFTLSWLRGPMTRQEIKRWHRDQKREPVSGPQNGKIDSAPTTTPSPVPEPRPSKKDPAIGQMPALPLGWKAIFPCAPGASTTEWAYQPYAAISVAVEFSDTKLGYREPRTLCLLTALSTSGIDPSQASEFNPQDFRHGQVDGARFMPIPDLTKSAKNLKSIEKSLRELAVSRLRTLVYVNEELEMVSATAESKEDFGTRCAVAASSTMSQKRSELVNKHEPKLQKLAAKREAARQAYVAAAKAAEGPGLGAMVAPLLRGKVLKAVQDAMTEQTKASEKAARLRVKLAEAESALTEAIGKRDADLAVLGTQMSSASTGIVTRELFPRKDSILVNYHAIAWIPA